MHHDPKHQPSNYLRHAALVRKERLALVAPETTAALTGRVVQVRQSGPHRDVVVALDQVGGDGRVRVEVEARLGTPLRPGDRTGVLLPASGGLWVVPEPGVSDTPSLPELVGDPAPRDKSTVTGTSVVTRSTKG